MLKFLRNIFSKKETPVSVISLYVKNPFLYSTPFHKQLDKKSVVELAEFIDWNKVSPKLISKDLSKFSSLFPELRKILIITENLNSLKKLQQKHDFFFLNPNGTRMISIHLKGSRKRLKINKKFIFKCGIEIDYSMSSYKDYNFVLNYIEKYYSNIFHVEKFETTINENKCIYC